MSYDLILGDFGAEAPLAGGAIHLILGEIEGAAGVVTDASVAVTLRVVASMAATVAAPAPGAPGRLGWGAAATAPLRAVGMRWGTAATAPNRAGGLPWGAFAGTNPGTRAVQPWRTLTGRQMAGPAARWGTAAQAPRGAQQPWGVASSRQRPAATPWGTAAQAPRGAQQPWGIATPGIRPIAAPWGLAARLPGVNRPLPAVPGEYGTLPPSLPTEILFCTPVGFDSLDLVLGDHICVTQPRIPDGTSVGVRRTYMQAHSLTAYRLPDMAPVPLTGFDLAADEGSFGWTLGATGPAEVLTLLAPVAGAPAQLRVTLDGLVFDFIVEGLRRTREFGKVGAAITARSAAALLADPYTPESAYLNSAPATAQQIVNEALQYTGVALDWQVTDWLVPAGAWSFTGTPLAVVRRVAESIGAIVQCPRTGDVVSIRPRYAVLPWDWAGATADVVLALDAITSEGYERADRPAYEGVYVSGQAQGVLALVKRTGTAPSLLLPSVTDALMTHLDAARQRGESMLGAVGPQASMSLTLPVLTGSGEPGIIDVGKLVQVNDPAGAWKGRVRSVSVRADHIGARQSLTLERHP